MGNTFWIIVVIAIIIGIIYKLYEEARYKVVRAKNFFVGQKGKCIYCKHCYRNGNEFVCALSKCNNIDEETEMDCLEKPVVTEQDIHEIYALDVFNEKGMDYIKESLLGKNMIYPEMEEFLTRIHVEHPEYMKKED